MKTENLQDGFLRLTPKKNHELFNESLNMVAIAVTTPEDSDLTLWIERPLTPVRTEPLTVEEAKAEFEKMQAEWKAEEDKRREEFELLTTKKSEHV
jgi:hypothetical protein